MENFWLIAIAILSYIFGSFSTAKLISRKKIEEWGGDSWGAMSTLQKTGKLSKGALVMFGDIFKGWLPVFTFVCFASYVGYNELGALAVSSAFVVLGHNYSANLDFKGGRGLSSGLGVLFAVNWILALISLAVMLVLIFSVELWMRGAFHGGFLKLARDNLLGRIIGIVLCLVAIYLFAGLWQFLALLPMMALIIFSHRERVRVYVMDNMEVLRKRFSIRGSR